MANQVPKPVTIAQAVFNLPVGNKDERVFNISELPSKHTSCKWEVTAYDLVLILDDLPPDYELIISRNK